MAYFISNIRTSLSACKIKEKRTISRPLLNVAGVAGLGTPAQKFAGPPRVVRLARLKIVLTNYPLRTKLVRLKTTLNPTKNPP